MTSGIPPELAAAVGERYELRSLLGRGGMATVYLAYDLKHHRVVALKVLRPELTASVGAARFLKEIQIVAQLTHPLILSLYDSGEASPFLYYVMPYISGGSLRQRLLDQGPMDAPAALTIAAPVADALTYAHGAGILHRDIKPENILFSQGHPMVADFGIAKAVSSATEAPLTRTGLSLGTPGYMSPEQAAGETDLDVRTDVYSLAAVFYEMVVGQVPGRWPSEDAVRAGRFLEAPAAHRARLAAAGSGIEGALVRGLAIREVQRTPTPAVLLDELRGAKPGRLYQSEEAVAIVQRAAELEAGNPTGSGAMTLGGVEALGREVGIPTGLVRSAAASYALRNATPMPEPRSNRVAGGPTRLAFERIVDGELPDHEFLYVVEEIRRVMGNAGQVSQLGRSFTWSLGRNPMNRSVEVSVSMRSGRTRILVNENLTGLVGAVFGPIGGGMGGGGSGLASAIAVSTFHNPAVLIAVIPLWLAATYATARTTYSRASRRRAQELRKLADRVAAVVQEVVGQPRLSRPI